MYRLLNSLACIHYWIVWQWIYTLLNSLAMYRLLNSLAMYTLLNSWAMYTQLNSFSLVWYENVYSIYFSTIWFDCLIMHVRSCRLKTRSRLPVHTSHTHTHTHTHTHSSVASFLVWGGGGKTPKIMQRSCRGRAVRASDFHTGGPRFEPRPRQWHYFSHCSFGPPVHFTHQTLTISSFGYLLWRNKRHCYPFYYSQKKVSKRIWTHTLRTSSVMQCYTSLYPLRYEQLAAARVV